VPQRVEIVLRVESGGGELADALTSRIALNLQKGVGAGGETIAFKAAAPSDIIISVA
jgi:hypothetical protein